MPINICKPSDDEEVEITHKTADVNELTLSDKSYSKTERDKFACKCGFNVEVVNFEIVMATGIIKGKGINVNEVTNE